MFSEQFQMLGLKEKLRKDACFNQFKTIYSNCAELERKGIKVNSLSFNELKKILVSNYMIPEYINENRYVAMCKSLIKGNTIFEDRE